MVASLKNLKLTGVIIGAQAGPVTVPYLATFESSGASTWTCPVGVTSVDVTVIGPGGKGGNALGGGGGGGGLAYAAGVSVTPGTVYNLYVGSVGFLGGDTSWFNTSSYLFANNGANGFSGSGFCAGGGGGAGGYGGNGGDAGTPVSDASRQGGAGGGFGGTVSHIGGSGGSGSFATSADVGYNAGAAGTNGAGGGGSGGANPNGPTGDGGGVGCSPADHPGVTGTGGAATSMSSNGNSGAPGSHGVGSTYGGGGCGAHVGGPGIVYIYSAAGGSGALPNAGIYPNITPPPPPVTGAIILDTFPSAAGPLTGTVPVIVPAGYVWADSGNSLTLTGANGVKNTTVGTGGNNIGNDIPFALEWDTQVGVYIEMILTVGTGTDPIQAILTPVGRGDFYSIAIYPNTISSTSPPSPPPTSFAITTGSPYSPFSLNSPDGFELVSGSTYTIRMEWDAGTGGNGRLSVNGTVITTSGISGSAGGYTEATFDLNMSGSAHIVNKIDVGSYLIS